MPPEPSKELGELLTKLKKRSKRNYELIGQRVNASRSTVHRYCTGQSVPAEFSVLERIALLCGADDNEIAQLLQLWKQAVSVDSNIADQTKNGANQKDECQTTITESDEDPPDRRDAASSSSLSMSYEAPADLERNPQFVEQKMLPADELADMKVNHQPNECPESHGAKKGIMPDGDTFQQSVTKDSSKSRTKIWTLNPQVLVVAIIAITIAGVSVIVFFQKSDATNSNNSINQNTSPCGQVGNNSNCIVELQNQVNKANDGVPQADDTEFKNMLAKDATADPSGSGPWPFVVVDALPNNLYARSTNQVKSDYLGIARDRSIVWADCVARSDFTPVNSKNNVGPLWVSVRWAPIEPPTAASVSTPSEKRTAWMYRGLLVPLRHNGKIPECSNGSYQVDHTASSVPVAANG